MSDLHEAPEQLTSETAAETSTPSSSRGPLWIALAAVGGFLLGMLGTLGVQAITSGAESAEADTRLTDAVATCGARPGFVLADNDTTLVIDVKGKEDASGVPYAAQECILTELGVPTRIESHIGQTTSMDGRQSASWDGITIEWSYHPNRGSDMVITLEATDHD